jgi:hypothetical protein
LVEGVVTGDPVKREAGEGTWHFAIESVRDGHTSRFTVKVLARYFGAAERVHKGTIIRLVGELHEDHWQDSLGNYQSRVCIIAEHVEVRPELPADGKKPRQKRGSGVK